MIRADFDNAASWMLTRVSPQQVGEVQKADVASVLERLHEVASLAKIPVLHPALFPGVALEVLYVPGDGKHLIDTPDLGDSYSRAGMSPKILALIGTAIAVEMKVSGNEVATLQLGGDAEVVAFLPTARSQVLQATGITLAVA